jgi:RimJ/RimL family protein N-acetyltransferase
VNKPQAGLAGVENRVVTPILSLDWMGLMADSNPAALPTARAFPGAVPILIDAEADVTLRAVGRGDLPAMVEQCRDPEMIRWTTVPTQRDGYQLRDAEEFLALTAAGWTSGRRLGWTIEAQRDGGPGFCGSINLDLEGDGVAEVGFGLHPEARGRSIMTAALQLVCDYGFELAGLQLIRWRALAGNWASRRVAAKVGFVFDGAVRGLLVQRGELHDGWIATLVRDDPRVPQRWLHPVEMQGTVSDCGPSAAPMSTASSKPAPTRIRHIGLSRCRGRTSATTHSPTSSPSASWPPVGPALPGA